MGRGRIDTLEAPRAREKRKWFNSIRKMKKDELERQLSKLLAGLVGEESINAQLSHTPPFKRIKIYTELIKQKEKENE